jgi:hypothetical protein
MADNDRRQEAQKQRETWNEGTRANSAAKDKIVVTISGAALGLSIAFLRDIKPDAEWKWMLGLGLAAFGLAVVLVLASMEITSWEIDRGVKRLDEWMDPTDGKTSPYHGERPDGTYYLYRKVKVKGEGRDQRERAIKLTDVLNLASVIATITGIVAVVVFVWRNL